MSSKMKWIVVPLVGLTLSFSLFIFLLGNIWVVACAPFIGGFAGMLGYGLTEKAKAFDTFFNWMNKD